VSPTKGRMLSQNSRRASGARQRGRGMVADPSLPPGLPDAARRPLPKPTVTAVAALAALALVVVAIVASRRGARSDRRFDAVLRRVDDHLEPVSEALQEAAARAGDLQVTGATDRDLAARLELLLDEIAAEGAPAHAFRRISAELAPRLGGAPVLAKASSRPAGTSSRACGIATATKPSSSARSHAPAGRRVRSRSCCSTWETSQRPAYASGTPRSIACSRAPRSSSCGPRGRRTPCAAGAEGSSGSCSRRRQRRERASSGGGCARRRRAGASGNSGRRRTRPESKADSGLTTLRGRSSGQRPRP
jgi:hypothetical protein